MGLFDSIRKKQNQNRLRAVLQRVKPYVFIPVHDVIWWHWEMVPDAEEAGILPQPDGLPVLMTEDECRAVNGGGRLPDYWGEMAYAWRTEDQKRSFYAKFPERFNRKQSESKTMEPDIASLGLSTPQSYPPRLVLHGLNAEDSILAIWKLLFNPTLQTHFGAGYSLQWTKKLIAKFAEGDHASFSAQYNGLLPDVKEVMSQCPKLSISNPPWSMVSLDMRLGLIPWITPVFDRGFAMLLQNRCALEKHFGDLLPFAFFLRGGPGNSQETAIRVCAPTSAVRASAEHWLMRAYLNRREQGAHATIGRDATGRGFSVHDYVDEDGTNKRIFFDTTDSFGREEEDFEDFLKGQKPHRQESVAERSGDREPVPDTGVDVDSQHNLYEIDMQTMSDEFLECWKAAGKHLNKQVDVGLSWLRADSRPPFLEHLSFRLGNQLFFIRVEDIDGKVRGPGSLHGLLSVAEKANGRACILPMKKQVGEGWVTDLNGWGLLDAETRRPINPAMFVSDEKIEMTPWEIHNMAVQVVRDCIRKQGFELMSWDGNPGVDPAIWFVGSSKKPEWVVVRSATYPVKNAPRPHNWKEIAKYCAKLSSTGHFASVSLVSADWTQGEPQPLWRGHAMHIRFTGLER